MCKSGNVYWSGIVYKLENVYSENGQSENARSEKTRGTMFSTKSIRKMEAKNPFSKSADGGIQTLAA